MLLIHKLVDIADLTYLSLHFIMRQALIINLWEHVQTNTMNWLDLHYCYFQMSPSFLLSYLSKNEVSYVIVIDCGK